MSKVSTLLPISFALLPGLMLTVTNYSADMPTVSILHGYDLDQKTANLKPVL
jgi:hypothetical protein